MLEQEHRDYVLKQQNLISAIAEICISPMQEVEALRILVHRGEAACRRYLRLVLIKQSQAFIVTARAIKNPVHIKELKTGIF